MKYNEKELNTHIMKFNFLTIDSTQ